MEKSYSLAVNQTQSQQQTQLQSESSNKGHIYDEAAIAAANLSLINKQSSPEPNKSYNQQKVLIELKIESICMTFSYFTSLFKSESI